MTATTERPLSEPHRAIPPIVEQPAIVAAAVGRRAPIPFLRVPLGLLLIVFAVGVLHSLVYALAFPRWALEDEPQHVDYVYGLAYDHGLPRIDDAVDPLIIQAMFEDRRWDTYGLPAPGSTEPSSLGLATFSYTAYHPPLPYVAYVPAATLTGASTATALIGLRLTAALVAGAVCVATALLAARLALTDPRPGQATSGHARRVALGAGLAAGLLPALAETGGRVNTDGFAALAVVVVAHLALSWYEHPDRRRALLVGVALGVAALTRETTVVAIVPVVAALTLAARRHRATREDIIRDVVLVLVPPAVATAAWTAWLWFTTGHLLGPGAFIDRFGAPFPPAGTLEVLGALPARMLVPFGEWNLPGVVPMALVGVVLAGVVFAARLGHRGPARIVLVLLVVQLAVMVAGAGAGLNTVTARLLLPSYPIVLAVSVVGWSRARGRTGALVVPGALGLFAVWFTVAVFLPRFPLGLP